MSAGKFNAFDGLDLAGRKITGVVESIGYGETDKKKQDGRVQVRMLIQDEKIQTEMLQWVKVAQSPHFGNIRGVGTSPGHRLTPGQMVELEFNGQQQLQVTGIIQNDETDSEERSSLHPYKDKKEDHVSTRREDFEKEWSATQGTPLKMQPRDAQRVNVENGTSARKEKKDPVESHNRNAPEPRRFGQARGIKSQTEKTPQTIAGFPRDKGSFLNATKNIQELLGTKGEIIPNELKMIQELQQNAKQGGIKAAKELVGGIGNITGALAGIQQLVNFVKNNQNNSGTQQEREENEELSELEQFLRALYEEETGQKPIDQFGNETREYQAWKAEKLKLLFQERENDNGTGVV